MNRTQDEEQRFRELLRAAVPEAPAIEPPARPRRSRGPVVAVLAAAAAVAAIVVVPVVVDRSGGVPTSRETPAVEPTTNPYRPRDRCPDILPDATATGRLPELDRVTSVRLCAAIDVQPFVVTPLPTAPLDGLVTRVDQFADTVDSLPELDGDLCPLIDRASVVFEALELHLDDGGTVMVTTSSCLPLETADGRELDAGSVTTEFLRALDRQRSDYVYPGPEPQQVPSCDQGATTAPVRPDRDEIVAATVCPSYNDRDGVSRALAGDALGVLSDAWAQTPDLQSSDVVGYDDEAAFVLARTDLGDLVRLSPVADGLSLESWNVGFSESPTAVVPIGLDDLR